MTVSALRTIVLGAPASAYGVCQPSLRWPMAEPDEVLDYSLDVSALLSDAGDTIASAAVSIAPSGTGELQASVMNIAGGIITVWLLGGVAGRDYTIRFEAETEGVPARTFEWLVGLRINPDLATYPLAPAPSLEFAPMTTTSATASLISSAAVEGSHVFSTTPVTFYAVNVSGLSDFGWLLVFDAITVPADGPNLTPIAAIQATQLSGTSIGFGGAAASVQHGLVAVLSSTGPFTKTSGPTGFFSALVR